jgi:hypothetical protein
MPFSVGRRRFGEALGSAAVAWPFVVRAQQLPCIGILFLRKSNELGRAESMLVPGLRELGWIDGKTARIESRYGNGDFTLFPSLA